MRKGIIQLFLFINLIIGSVGISKAQNASEYRTHIPFDFTVGGKLFSAGDYSINFAGLTASQRKLTIRSANGKESALVVVMPKETTEQSNSPALVFNLYDNAYSLAEIKTSQLSAELYKSKTESKLAKNSKRVELALTR